MRAEIAACESLVRDTLEHHRKARNDDKELLIVVWAKCGLSLTREQEEAFIHRCYAPESITRCRRKIQEGGEFPSEKEVAAARKEEEKSVRKWAGNQSELF